MSFFSFSRNDVSGEGSLDVKDIVFPKWHFHFLDDRDCKFHVVCSLLVRHSDVVGSIIISDGSLFMFLEFKIFDNLIFYNFFLMNVFLLHVLFVNFLIQVLIIDIKLWIIHYLINKFWVIKNYAVNFFV